MKIYTKKGDKGETSLLGGSRIPKDDIQISAYGTVDELNSAISFIPYYINEEEIKILIKEIQSQLFLIGSYLAMSERSKFKLPEIQEEAIQKLENSIDKMEKELPPLKNFVLPGGHIGNSFAHLARTICRRAERKCVALSKEKNIHPLIVPYLNRLSDWLFVVARFISYKNNAPEIPWEIR